jgi:lipopolysaccharide transport system ATP-binding protein
MIRGRIGSLLEVGTGFHPELTGRENIYLNGSILGMSRREIRSKFDEIVAFAEVDRFLDTPVKRYSSGMYVRLAFAVAAHLEPEILLVDEVLAVGDAAFQRKCMGKMGEVSRQGRTILFVSHNMAAITRLCRRAIWLDGGRVRDAGAADEVIAKYLAFGASDAGEVTFHDNGRKAPGSEYVVLEAARARGDDGTISPTLDVRRPFALEVQYRVLRRTTNLRVGLRLLAHDGTVLLSSTDTDGGDDELLREPGVYVSRCTVPGDLLNYGQYFVSVGCDFPMQRSHFAVDQALSFTVEQTGGVGGHISDGRTGMLRLRLPWNVERIRP